MDRYRVRIRYRKEGDLRMISHRDLLRTLERLFRRAGLDLRMSEGFHPRPRMTFPLALAVGIAGTNEIMELELASPAAEVALLALLRKHAPAGLSFDSVETRPPGAPKPRIARAVYEIDLPESRATHVARRAEALLAGQDCHVVRRGDEDPIDLRHHIDELQVRGHTLLIGLRVGQPQAARPRDVLAALELEDLELGGCHLRRTCLELGT